MEGARIKLVLGTFLGLTDVDHISKWLSGRPRFTIGFVRAALRSETSSNIIFQAYLKKMTTMETTNVYARDDGTVASLVDKVKRNAFNPKSNALDKHRGALLSNACLKYCLTGQPVVPGREKELLFLEYGFAYGRVNADYLGLSDILESTECVVFEPLVAHAIFEAFFATGTLEERLQSTLEPSAMGFQFETAIPFIFPVVLFKDGQNLEEHLYFTMYKDELPDWVKGKWKIGGSAYSVFANGEGEDDVNTVAKWLRKWRDSGWGKAIGRLPPFFYPGKAFGGDVLWLAFNVDNYHPTLWIIQSKLASKFNLEKAMRVLRPELAYQENRETTKPVTPKKWITPRDEYLAEIVDIPIVTVLLAFPATVNFANPAPPPSDRVTRSGRQQTPQLLPTKHVQQFKHRRGGAKFEQDLQLIIDASNMDTFLSSDQLHFLRMLKEVAPVQVWDEE